ncbi:hypothetical protein [uncultured Clostridium sp.]|jgi:hypothetical protein|uniref:hypothetical protein n=1 Tax=uncultured Clostridium sp. TaxID=59620 RepID=UPI002611969B|nr:hypothetical protein [uncultured Clostridium sp.]
MGFNNNDIDKIKLPDNFDERIKNTVDKAYKEKNKKSKRGKKVAIAAGLAFAVSTGFVVSNPEYVEATIQKIREVFKTRNYNIVLEDGTESFEATYKMEHMGVEITFDIDTSIPGIIKIKERVDSSNIKLEDWKLDTKHEDANVSLDNITLSGSGSFDDEYQTNLYKKIYENKNILEELEYVKENGDGQGLNVEGVLKVKEYYEWGMSDADFINKRIQADTSYNIKEAFYSDQSGESKEISESCYESETEIRIEEEVLGKKELNLEIELSKLSLHNYAVGAKKKVLNIPLKATRKKSAVKYIPINHSYKAEGMRDSIVQELIAYPDGKVELIYNYGSHKDKDYKITKFRIENEDGTRLTDVGGGKISMGQVENWADVPVTRSYEGKITGDTVKLIPVVTHNTNKNIVVDKDEPILKEIEPIIVKVK